MPISAAQTQDRIENELNNMHSKNEVLYTGNIGDADIGSLRPVSGSSSDPNESVDDSHTSTSDVLVNQRGRRVSRSKIMNMVWDVVDGFEDRLSKLPVLDAYFEILAKYQAVLDTFQKEAKTITLKDIITYIESKDCVEVTEQIIEYFKQFNMNNRLLSTIDIEKNHARIDFIEYFLYINNNKEANVNVLGPQLNEQFQLFRNDSSKVAPPLRYTFSQIRSYSAFAEPCKHRSGKKGKVTEVKPEKGYGLKENIEILANTMFFLEVNSK
ncbi:hypothetical protein PICST_28751 [Scheffersomyces stipitis CBS 6054]|uniref:Uncharacterized protein n=1 Tax=Scheffersomyces stipitis (strain ATCC 58785 / CBS 6054 / NBRC 10063 / NRRL Y-11545) TaxID=322104 RepID=A3GGV4_PICST|nr:predicted protein [Scheffersomyces stipitis CBS 6054]EAZ63595.2 hypothetical protein PICST_28751 [Scheffersomyces stipitis CBS 6054]